MIRRYIAILTPPMGKIVSYLQAPIVRAICVMETALSVSLLRSGLLVTPWPLSASSIFMAKNTLFGGLAAVAILLYLCGCTTVSTVQAIGNVADAALQATGLKKPVVPEVPDALKPPRTVSIQLHASDALNLDSSGRPLALVAKIYKLRQVAAFQQASYDTFLNLQKEKELLGADLIESKEVTLIPGQRFEISEKVSREAYFIGIVGLFNNPSPLRWRVNFGAASAEQTGIIVGVHACSLTVGTGIASTDSLSKIQWLSTVRCP